jgi:hypothetical protein
MITMHLYANMKLKHKNGFLIAISTKLKDYVIHFTATFMVGIKHKEQ